MIQNRCDLAKQSFSLKSWTTNSVVPFDPAIKHCPPYQIKGSIFLRIVFLAMKYVHSPHILNKLDDICVLFKELSRKVDAKNFFDTFSLYVQNAAPDNLIEQSVKKIKSWKRGENMSDDMSEDMSENMSENMSDNMSEVSRYFQSLRDEGWSKGWRDGWKDSWKESWKDSWKEGKLEGEIEIAQRMLQKEMSKELVIEITGLPFDKIDELEKYMNQIKNNTCSDSPEE